MSKVLVTGASGVAGRLVSRLLADAGHEVRRADVAPPPPDPTDPTPAGEFVRCDTRTPTDVQAAVAGCDAVVHLAAWHSGHQPPVSDATIFAVNVDGTFNLVQACREANIGSVVFASSMAYGWGGVYGLTKVLGEDLWRMYHQVTGASVAMLRYHDFVPKPYLAWGPKLLRNGVDRRDVAAATVAALTAVLGRRVDLFTTIVHTDHHLPAEVRRDFATTGLDWFESQLPGSSDLLQRHRIELPDEVEQHDLSKAERLLGWVPAHDFTEFLTDLARRDAAGEDVGSLWAPGQLPTEV
jgi:nucleoside-diphosphate-sugar epimerase